MRGLKGASLGLLVTAIVVLTTIAVHALTFPALTGRVVDEAGILDEATRQALTDKLAAVEAKSGDQIVVVTLKSLQGTSIADYGYQLGRTWAIGQKDKNNGALLIVVPSERRVRIEAGYGLEGALTDAVTQLIIQNAILPRFRAGDFAGGISRGVDDMIQVVSGDAEDFQRRAAQRPDDAPQAVDFATIMLLLFMLFIVFMMMRNQGGGGRPVSRRGGGYAGPIFIPSGGSWSSGSWGGGGSDGGFSGGGGSFGGGGSSGSW